MNQDQDVERNERATPFRLEDARKRGQVAKSVDVVSLAVLLAAVVSAYALVPDAMRVLAKLVAKLLSSVPASALALENTHSAASLIGRCLLDGMAVMAPVLFAITLAAVLVGLLQAGGLTVSAAPVTPDLQRLNPVQGLRRLLSARVLIEAIKSLSKLALIVAVPLFAFDALMPKALALFGLQPTALLFRWMEASGHLLAQVCGALLIMAAIDYGHARWDFLKNLRMSRREVEEELKSREGDPRLRHRQRELRRQFLQAARSVRKVPQAQVVLTNPSHVAVALRYEHGVTPAPLLLAKGAGVLASQIRREAYRAGVPVVRSPRLARVLYRETSTDSFVPDHCYAEVARILIWLRSLSEARRGASA